MKCTIEFYTAERVQGKACCFLPKGDPVQTFNIKSDSIDAIEQHITSSTAFFLSQNEGEFVRVLHYR